MVAIRCETSCIEMPRDMDRVRFAVGFRRIGHRYAMPMRAISGRSGAARCLRRAHPGTGRVVSGVHAHPPGAPGESVHARGRLRRALRTDGDLAGCRVLHGASTRRLFGLSDLLAATWPLFAIGGALICAVWVWSFAAVVPPWRRLVEGIGPWRLYRDVQATRFLALLDVLLRRHGNLDARLRTALAAQRPYARPWMAWHLDSMLDRIEAGEVGADTFDTGLLDRRLWWFLGDMTLAHGLEAGLRLARERVQSHLLPAVARQASVLRWWILLSVVAQLIALMLWHYQVIDELRRALAQVYASY